MFLAASLLSGCGDNEKTLVLSTNNWLGYTPLYVARDEGYYDNIPLKLMELPSNSESMRAFRNGKVAAAGLTLDETILLAESGVSVCIPLIMDYSNGADALVAKAGITSLAELRGKRIGVENTAVAAHMLTRVLDKAGLSLRDVTVVPLGIEQHSEAFHEDRIDAVVTFDPVRSLLLSEGASQLFSSADIPGEITDVLAVDRAYLSENPEVISTLLEGWNRVVDGMHKKDNQGVVRQIAQYSGLSTDTVNTTLKQIIFPDRKRNRDTLYNSTDAFREMARKMNESMLKGKVIGSQVDVDRLLCPPEHLTVYQ